MSWIDAGKLETAQDKLDAKAERNRQKALAAQKKALEKAEEDDLKVKYGIGAKLKATTKKDLSVYIKAMQEVIDNPPTVDSYEPPTVPGERNASLPSAVLEATENGVNSHTKRLT